MASTSIFCLLTYIVHLWLFLLLISFLSFFQYIYIYIYISIRCNQLTFVPYELAFCTKLKSLTLCHNRISTVHQILEPLYNLNELNLSQNRLNADHLSSSHFPVSLTSINLSGNSLSTLPANIHKMVNLTSLNLEGNRFRFEMVMLYLDSVSKRN